MSIIGKNPDLINPLDIYIATNRRVVIPAKGTLDFLSILTRDQIASSDIGYHVIEGQLLIKSVGAGYLSKLDALDLIKGYNQKLITNLEGSIQVTPTPIVGSRATISTHNFCDPTTWHTESIRESGVDGYGEVLTSSDGYLTYNSSQVNWIDTTHGKITGEDSLSGYSIQITVDGYNKTEDIDFTIDYVAGDVIFNSALVVSNQVKAIYSYENGSSYTIGPKAGKKLRILTTEVQFGVSTTINYKYPIKFQAWVYNPYDLPNKVPYGPSEMYKGVTDIINISNGGTSIPKFGDLKEAIIIVPFAYAAITDLQSSVGAEIRINIVGDVPLDGYTGNLTAYALSEDE